jgi:hypothetical protein
LGFLIVPEAEVRVRLGGLVVGVMFVGWGVHAANQTGGIVIIPVRPLSSPCW